MLLTAAPARPAESATSSSTAPGQVIVTDTPAAPSGRTPVALGDDQVKSFRDYLAGARKDSGLPGLAVAMVQPGRVLLLEAFGNRTSVAGSIPLTPDTRFALGPVTQAFNSLLLAKLADEKIIDLDLPAWRCWGDFKLSDADASRTAALRQLLFMTAGVPDYADETLRKPAATPADLFTVLAQVPVLAQPGGTFSYSETSAAAAGYLATMAANNARQLPAGLPVDYVALATKELLDPLAMKRASFGPPSSTPADDDAVGHTQVAGGWQPTPASSGANGGALLPARGLRASATDLAAWLQLEISGGLAPGGKRLVSETLMKQRWAPEKVVGEQQWGMGWIRQFYRGVELVARVGTQDNQTVLVVLVPRYRTAAAVLLNGGGHPSDVLLQDVLLNFADFLREAAKE